MAHYIAVDITEDDIRLGQTMICTECPIARALNRMFPGFWAHVFFKITVTSGPHGDKISWAYKYTERSSHFINDFDQGKPVKPCRVWLEAV